MTTGLGCNHNAQKKQIQRNPPPVIIHNARKIPYICIYKTATTNEPAYSIVINTHITLHCGSATGAYARSVPYGHIPTVCVRTTKCNFFPTVFSNARIYARHYLLLASLYVSQRPRYDHAVGIVDARDNHICRRRASEHYCSHRLFPLGKTAVRGRDSAANNRHIPHRTVFRSRRNSLSNADDA